MKQLRPKQPKEKTKHVAVGIITATRNNQPTYLLVASVLDFGQFTGYYYPPGGHIPTGTDEKTILSRKVLEEVGLEIEPIRKIAETPGDVANQITHWWGCKVIEGKFKINKSSLHDAGYFTQKEMVDLPVWPATRKFFARYIFPPKSK